MLRLTPKGGLEIAEHAASASCPLRSLSNALFRLLSLNSRHEFRALEFLPKVLFPPSLIAISAVSSQLVPFFYMFRWSVPYLCFLLRFCVSQFQHTSGIFASYPISTLWAGGGDDESGSLESTRSEASMSVANFHQS